MLQLKILNGSRLSNKEFTVTSRRKPSRRKKHYVHSGDYEKYMRIKNKVKDSIEDIIT